MASLHASGQFSTGSAAASKFSLLDPLGGNNEEKSLQQAVTEEVNDRMGRAVGELKEKYTKGGEGFDAQHDNQPTGLAYQKAREEKAERIKQVKAQEKEARQEAAAEEEELQRQLRAHKLEEASDNDEDDYDDDPELDRIRQLRLQELKGIHEERATNIAKGHGQFREISQDEFLPEVTGSERVVVHFYHIDFERCKIMDMHLSRLARAHIECKFIKINAEKAPFFVSKLQVRVLPCVVVLRNGITVVQIQGFEGLNEGMPKGKEDEWPTTNLAKKLALAQAITYTEVDTEGDGGGSSALDKLRAKLISEGINNNDDFGSDDD